MPSNAMAAARTISDEELMQLPKDGNKYELVDGELVVSTAGARHEKVCVQLAALLVAFVRETKQDGEVFGSNLLYILPSGTRRGPDMGYVSRGRLPGGRVPEGLLE